MSQTNMTFPGEIGDVKSQIVGEQVGKYVEQKKCVSPIFNDLMDF